METDNKTKLKGEYDRFLNAYNEESTLRSSKEAFMQVLSALRETELASTPPCSNCGAEHPVVRVVFFDKKEDHFWVVALEMRSGMFTWINKTRQEALQEMKEHLPEAMPDPLKILFMAIYHMERAATTLEDLAGENIRPYHIVKFLRDNLDKVDFLKSMNTEVTQAPALA